MRERERERERGREREITKARVQYKREEKSCDNCARISLISVLVAGTKKIIIESAERDDTRLNVNEYPRNRRKTNHK